MAEWEPIDEAELAEILPPILRANGWGNCREYARHIPFMLRAHGLRIAREMPKSAPPSAKTGNSDHG